MHFLISFELKQFVILVKELLNHLIGIAILVRADEDETMHEVYPSVSYFRLLEDELELRDIIWVLLDKLTEGEGDDSLELLVCFSKLT